MKNNYRKTLRIAAFICVFIFMFLFTTCEYLLDDKGYFEYKLRGTWVTNVSAGLPYSGTIVIDYNTIKITNYNPNIEYETVYGLDRRPFRDITKGTPLNGYSEDNKIYYNDKGSLQEGIPYNYYTTNSGNDKFLEFKFGNDVNNLYTETLQKME